MISIKINGAKSIPPKFGKKDLIGLYKGSKSLFKEFQICKTIG